MLALDELQDAMRNTILGAPSTSLHGVISDDRLGMDARLQIYRNNTHILLSDALAANFPTVLSLVGSDFFKGLTTAFIRSHPPKSPCLYAYGNTFATYIASFSPAQELPYLSHVARLDYAINQVMPSIKFTIAPMLFPSPPIPFLPLKQKNMDKLSLLPILLWP